ncbi:endonuclease VII domain-containing protein [Micromonospora tarensis]|uniref:Endonuclease VII domain-containing protein n=1 Tax=Micromonospora tarensis TaxID=2806100 RepID=A0ABS1YQU4_9ACTN|nr:endonuclease VII domain-containing protein [Micromonospora tarensis]MBM0279673.1 endonuclease VII domain-containing protein [Micromonospora tarensis]
MIAVDETKRCRQCGKHRDRGDFVSDGPGARCGPCRHRDRERQRVVEGGVSRIRERSLWSFYRITPEQYDAMRVAQGHRCAICRRHEDELPVGRTGRPRLDGSPPAEAFRLVVDHCHDTKVVRGLLCVACNSAIGQMRDSVDVLAAAIRYLNRDNGHSHEPEREIDMLRRRVTATVRCTKSGCGETAHYEYDSQRDRREADRWRKDHPWRCYRHTNEDEVLSATNAERTTVLTAVKVDYGHGPLPGLSWRAEGASSGGGLVSGPGFKAIASDLPEGARLIVTARIELPEA